MHCWSLLHVPQPITLVQHINHVSIWMAGCAGETAWKQVSQIPLSVLGREAALFMAGAAWHWHKPSTTARSTMELGLHRCPAKPAREWGLHPGFCVLLFAKLSERTAFWSKIFKEMSCKRLGSCVGLQQMPARVQDGSASDAPAHLQTQGTGCIPLCCPSSGTPLIPSPWLGRSCWARLLEINSHHFFFFPGGKKSFLPLKARAGAAVC